MPAVSLASIYSCCPARCFTGAVSSRARAFPSLHRRASRFPLPHLATRGATPGVGRKQLANFNENIQFPIGIPRRFINPPLLPIRVHAYGTRQGNSKLKQKTNFPPRNNLHTFLMVHSFSLSVVHSPTSAGLGFANLIFSAFSLLSLLHTHSLSQFIIDIPQSIHDRAGNDLFNTAHALTPPLQLRLLLLYA